MKDSQRDRVPVSQDILPLKIFRNKLADGLGLGLWDRAVGCGLWARAVGFRISSSKWLTKLCRTFRDPQDRSGFKILRCSYYIHYNIKYFCFSNRLFLSKKGYAEFTGLKRPDNSFSLQEVNCCKHWKRWRGNGKRDFFGRTYVEDSIMY